MIKKLLNRLHEILTRWTAPDREDLVLSLVLHTASLELAKDEYWALAPIKGTCGPFMLTGNSLPVFTYRVFDKKLMEFIHMRVEVARPNRIDFFAQIESTDKKAHGKEVEVKPKYQEPFLTLITHLYRYFPFYRGKAS